MENLKLSVIVPTYEETENIRPLTERLFNTVREAEIETELIFVDDDSGIETVRTQGIVQELKSEGFPVTLRVRKKDEGKGLSSAVLLGFSMAKFDTILCMDADLQHEPESVPSVAGPVLRKESEFTIGSRLVEGGAVAGWTFMRKTISYVATLMARPLTPGRDPMSGFFCTTKEVLTRSPSINPRGFKIALEIMSRCAPKNVMDVPITFQDRVAGESKLSSKVMFHYLFQLLELYFALYLPYIVCFVVLLLAIFVIVLRNFGIFIGNA